MSADPYDWNEHSVPEDFYSVPLDHAVVRRLLCGADVASRLRDLPAVRAPSTHLSLADDEDLCYLVNFVRSWAGREL